MRRGHPGAWRNDGSRHFRPRGGPAPMFRGPRNYGSQNMQRFPGPRFPGGPFNHPGFEDNAPHPRGQYHNRSIFPRLQRMRQPLMPDHVNPFPETPFYDDNVDGPPNFGRPSPWVNPPQAFYENQKRPFNEPKPLLLNPNTYPGHRPPASEHFGSNPAAANDNSDTFTHSVDDTVDIVRKRLISRVDSHNSSDNTSSVPHDSESTEKHITNKDSPAQQCSPPRKKIRPRNAKLNCDQIKDKIVHQMFKMDKGTIRKLMDNPKSSSKFEYAISSLVTESQNSYNSHLRSMAEKSLCSTSTEFIHDNNSIYEDTFMKQMQCILDPQDTVLLEDLKPLVLAELSKVLQLNLDQTYEEQAAYPARNDEHPAEENFGNEYPYNAFSAADDQNYHDQGSSHSSERQADEDTKPLFERRTSRKSPETNHSHKKERSHQKHRSSDRCNEDDYGNRTLSSEVGTRRDVKDHSGSSGRTSREETAWGNKYSNVEDLYSRSRSPNPNDRYEINKIPVAEDKFTAIRIPVQDTGFGLNSSATEDRYKGSKTTIPEDKFVVSNIPRPDDRFSTANVMPSAEDRNSGSKTPIPENRFMAGTISNNSFTDSVTPTPENRSGGSKTPTPENRFAGSKTPIPEDPFMNSKPLNLDERIASFTETRRETENRSQSPAPVVFDVNMELLSDEDEAFAELDRQYHVAIDRNFTNYDLESPPDIFMRDLSPEPPLKPKSPERKPSKPIKIKPPQKPAPIDKDIDKQLLSLAESPLKLIPELKKGVKNEVKSDDAISISDQSTPNISGRWDSKENVSIEKQDSQNDQNASPSNSRKRSIDQQPAHRKEKRKKSELETNNKQITLRKKIVINVKDCVKSSDDPNSMFNLFNNKSGKELVEKSGKESVEKSEKEPVEKSVKESMQDVKKHEKEATEKWHDKHVKRKDNKEKEPSKKSKEIEKKQTAASLAIKSPPVSNSQIIVREDNKGKLKDFDMFEDFKKKTVIVRLPDQQKKLMPVRPIVDNTKFGIGRKLTKRHVGTQVVRKIMSKETQTTASKCCSCKDKKRQATLSVQTEPVTFRPASKTIDPFERMKEIDMEIQVLLQEKFTLYNSIENKDFCPTGMQSLGMTVLDVDVKDSKNEQIPDLEDSIVDSFANIPVEELEQIALESVDSLSETPVKGKKQKTKRRRTTSSSVSSIKSPVATRNKKKTVNMNTPNLSLVEEKTPNISLIEQNTPNISLIEQIITDDRPIEEIISLDELETTPVTATARTPVTAPARTPATAPALSSSKKKYTKKSQPKKAQTQKPKAQANQKGSVLQLMIAQVEYGIKDCCVVLKREDLSKYMTKNKQKVNPITLVKIPKAKLEQFTVAAKENKKKSRKEKASEQPKDKNKSSKKQEKSHKESPIQEQPDERSVIEEAVVNELQFDMLDVSEDIVIGDNCEVKATVSPVPTTICEEIILDNSQSSIEDVVIPVNEPNENECKLYDFSADETLKRDSITVSGNADAVLAIEIIDDNFIAACLDGNVYYFSGEGQLLNTLRGSNLAVTCLCIVREKHGITVYTGSLDSRIRYYDLETGLEKGPEGNVLSPIQSMDRAWDTIFVGTRTGFVLQFECKNNMLIPVSTVKFSEQSILALRAMKEGPRKVLLVAARSEPVTIKDAQSGLLLRTLDGPKMTVYSLLFEDGKVYCGTSNHQIHVYDYSSGGHVGVHEGGKGAVCLRAAGSLVFAGCYDGCVYVYREGQSQPMAQLRGPGLMLLSLAVIGSKIIAGYKDRSLYIWKMPVSILSEMIL